MDPLTHAVLGGAIGQALFHRSLGRKAAIAGALAAAIPDLDFVWRVDEWSAWKYHRGVTHSLWFGPVVGPLLGWALWRQERRRGGRPPGDSVRRRWALTWACVLGLLSHPLLDLLTPYGTQLLAPFSDRRFAIDAIAVIDPVYSLPLLAAVALALWRPARTGLARGSAVAALVVANAYLLYTWHLNEAAEAEARDQLAAEGVAPLEVTAYPTIFQAFLRRVVVRLPDETRVGFVTMLDPRPIRWRSFRPPDGPYVAQLAARPESELLEWFAMGQTGYRVIADGVTVTVEQHDLRYGRPGPPDQGLWGVRAVFDRSGDLQAPPSVFRNQPDFSSENLGMLWRLTIGLRAGGP